MAERFGGMGWDKKGSWIMTQRLSGMGWDGLIDYD